LNSKLNPRILIVRVGAMGDVLHGMPAVAALRAALPSAFIGWAIEPRWSPLLLAPSEDAAWKADLPLVDGVHLVEAKAWSKHPFSIDTVRSVRALWHSLQNERYDIAIDLQGSIRSAVIARLSGAQHVVGNANPRESPARLLYTQSVPVHALHVVEQAAEIVSAAAQILVVPETAALPHDTAAERWCDGVLGQDTRRIVFVAPTAGWGAKQWPVAKFAAVAIACGRAGLRVLVNKAGPNDTVADDLLRAADGFAEPVDCTVSQLIAMLRRVSLVIAGDTGPLHLAAALNTPTIALFGPTDPARNGPFGAPARVLRSASSITDHRRHAATEAGLASISTAEVLAAAEDLLGTRIL
jgi:heptosyltransferase-1